MNQSQLALLVLFAMGAAPTASAQSGGASQDSTAYCDSLCLIPLEDRVVQRAPPFMCDCMVIISGGGSGGDTGDPMTPRQLLDRMWETYEMRVANVDNYTVVQTTSSAPMPVVLYYEKEVTEGHSTFQLVSPSELADREAAANGQPTSQQIGAGIVSLADMLGGLVGGGSPEGSPDSPADDASRSGDGSGGGGARSSATGDGGSSGEGGSRQPLLNQIVDGIRDFGEGLQEGRGRFEKQEGLMDDLFWNQEFIDTLDNQGTQEVYIDGEYIMCDVLYGDFWNNPMMGGIDLGEGSEGYGIISARMWIASAGQEWISFQPVAMDIHLKRPDGAPLLLKRTMSDFTPASPYSVPVPRRTKFTMEGIAGLVQGGINDVWTELQLIQSITANDGPPTSEQAAQMIADAIEQLGL